MLVPGKVTQDEGEGEWEEHEVSHICVPFRQRDASTVPLSTSEQRRVDFMCTEWSHPYFISIKVGRLSP